MDADFIIVGAGTAGCVMAARLIAASKTCILMEAGGDDAHPYVKIPAAFAKLFKSSRDWAYETAPQAHLDGRRVFWPRGKMLGGSSSMNALIHQWCDPADFEAWGAEWSPREMIASLKRNERWTGPQSQARGSGGGLNVAHLRDPHPLSLAFVEAARRVLGPCSDDYNQSPGTGAWLSQATHENGARCNAANAFLRPAIRRGGVVLLTKAHAFQIAFAGRCASAVRYRRNGRERVVRARCGIILCAGAVNTPMLLLHSGIGPAVQLAHHGIALLADSPSVGANLQDHLMAVVLHGTARRDTLKKAESPASLLRYIAVRRGMLASNVAEAMAFFSSVREGKPDLEIVFAPAVYADEGLKPPAYHGFSLGVVLLAPKSRGQVSLASSDPYAAPQVDPAYLSDPDAEDLRRLVFGVRKAREIANAPPLARESAGETEPGSYVETDAAIKEFIRSRAHTIYHPVGSCRMGDDRDAVVDRRLAVRGVDNLWIADASVMPSIPRGHPNAVVAALADRGSALILDAVGSRQSKAA